MIKLEHVECEANGCQYNVTAGKLADAERDIEQLQLKEREWTGMKSEIQLCHPKIERLEAEVERLRTLNEVLRKENPRVSKLISGWVTSCVVQSNTEIANLREALEYLIKMRVIKCLHNPCWPDLSCAKCKADKALKEIK